MSDFSDIPVIIKPQPGTMPGATAAVFTFTTDKDLSLHQTALCPQKTEFSLRPRAAGKNPSLSFSFFL